MNSRWEPVIETSDISVEFSKNSLTSPLLMAHLGVDSKLLINVPTQMIA